MQTVANPTPSRNPKAFYATLHGLSGVITTPADDGYLTLRQAARIMQCSTLTLYRACWAGRLKYRRMNRNIRVTRAWLDQWMLGRKVR